MYAHVILIVIGYHLPTYSCTYTHRYFPVCNGGLVPDIMHDVLEGALEYEVKLMLAHMISEEKYFTLNQFNSRLENFINVNILYCIYGTFGPFLLYVLPYV